MTNPSADRLKVSAPTDTTIVLTRTFHAPRIRVWEAMFTPERMRRWILLPPGWIMTECHCDAKVGGALRMASRTDDADPAMTLEGVFTEVVPHERAVHTESMALGSGEVVGSLVETHEFHEDADGTGMRITQEYPSKAARDGALESGMIEGMEAGYRRLDALLASPGPD